MEAEALTGVCDLVDVEIVQYALTLDVARVHDTLLYHLIFAESASLLEHLIDQSSLAMVNVRNDGDVA